MLCIVTWLNGQISHFLSSSYDIPLTVLPDEKATNTIFKSFMNFIKILVSV